MLQCFGFSNSISSHVMEFVIHLINLDDFDELKENVSDEHWEILKYNFSLVPKYIVINCLSTNKIKDLINQITKKLNNIIKVESILYNYNILDLNDSIPLISSNFLSKNKFNEKLFYNYHINRPKFTFSSSSYKDYTTLKENSSSLYYFQPNTNSSSSSSSSSASSSLSLPSQYDIEVISDDTLISENLDSSIWNKKLLKNLKEDDNFFRPRLIACFTLNINLLKNLELSSYNNLFSNQKDLKGILKRGKIIPYYNFDELNNNVAESKDEVDQNISLKKNENENENDEKFNLKNELTKINCEQFYDILNDKGYNDFDVFSLITEEQLNNEKNLFIPASAKKKIALLASYFRGEDLDYLTKPATLKDPYNKGNVNNTIINSIPSSNEKDSNTNKNKKNNEKRKKSSNKLLTKSLSDNQIPVPNNNNLQKPTSPSNHMSRRRLIDNNSMKKLLMPTLNISKTTDIDFFDETANNTSRSFATNSTTNTNRDSLKIDDIDIFIEKELKLLNSEELQDEEYLKQNLINYYNEQKIIYSSDYFKQFFNSFSSIEEAINSSYYTEVILDRLKIYGEGRSWFESKLNLMILPLDGENNLICKLELMMDTLMSLIRESIYLNNNSVNNLLKSSTLYEDPIKYKEKMKNNSKRFQNIKRDDGTEIPSYDEIYEYVSKRCNASFDDVCIMNSMGYEDILTKDYSIYPPLDKNVFVQPHFVDSYAVYSAANASYASMNALYKQGNLYNYYSKKNFIQATLEFFDNNCPTFYLLIPTDS